MESGQAMKAYRAPAAQRVLNPSKTGPTHPANVAPKAAPAAKSWLEMNPAELHQYVTKQVQSNTRAELAPYRQKAGEITGTEQAVGNRYGGYGQQTDQQLAGLQGQAAQGARTFNNQIADTVLKAQQSVDTTGQNAQAQNAGYLDPQVRAALAAQQGNVQATGVAAQTAAQSQGQSSQNLLANQRAAAAQRVVEGQGAIAGKYGQQRAANTSAENQLLGRMPGQITKQETELGQRQFNARATEQGLGIKLGALQQKGQETTAKLRTTERGQNLSVKENQERVRATERGQTLAQYRNQENNRVRERGQDITQAHYKETDSIARQRAEAAARKGGLTSTQQGKLAADFGSAYESIRQLREQKLSPTQIRDVLSTGYLKAEANGKPTTLKFSKISDPVLVQAAFEVWNYHHVSPKTAAALKRMGFTTKPQELVGL